MSPKNFVFFIIDGVKIKYQTIVVLIGLNYFFTIFQKKKFGILKKKF